MDLLIRDIPEEDIASMDEASKRRGISRVEYVRRLLHQDAGRVNLGPTRRQQWERFAELASDLATPDFELRAWGTHGG